MDTFIEQLVVIENGVKTKVAKISIWTVCIMLALGLIALSIFNPSLAFFTLMIAAAAVFCAYYMCGQLNNEFEYIITNRDIDIDRIVNKKKRIRMASFTCSDIEDIEKYDPYKHVGDKSRNINVYFGCTPDESAYAFKIKHPKNGHYFLVITPNEDFRNAVRKFVQYNLKSKI